MTSAGEGSFGALVDFINQKGVVQTNDYLVQAQGTPDMTVKATPGTAYLPSIASVPPSINATIYSSILDANSNVTIAANGSGVAKIDAVVLYIDTAASADATASNVAKLTSVRGTASATPTDAEIQTAVGASNPFLRLADVAVANGTASINSGNITDKRVYCDPLVRRSILTPSLLTELGTWNVSLEPTHTTSIVAGTWTNQSPQASQYKNGWLYNGAGAALNDEITYKVFLQAGTYTVSFLSLTNTDCPIITITLGGVSLGTIDFYTASTVFNALKQVTGVALPTSGVQTLDIKITGKNASSGAYILRLTSINFTRTA